MQQPLRNAHLFMMLATVLVATSFPVGAAITHGLDSLVLTLLRFVLAAVLFAPLVAWRYGLSLPNWRDLARYGAVSACLVGFFWGMFAALRYTSVLNTATIFTLTPVIAAVVSAVLLKEKLSGAARLALPVGIIGAIWVIFRGDLAALISLKLGRGDAIFLAATVAMGFYGPLVKILHRGEPMAQMTFWTLVTGAFWLLVLSAPRLSGVEWAAVPMSVYSGIVYLAVFTTLITFFAVQWSTTIIGPTKVMSYTYLNPAIVLVLGLAFGQESPTLATYPGLILIVAATYILLRSDAGGR
ncbi:MAG: DMT family transporter [Alphaproteobacteria bacterium]|nr:DMT family transporter [Alphaproteobacteria bacterium]